MRYAISMILKIFLVNKTTAAAVVQQRGTEVGTTNGKTVAVICFLLKYAQVLAVFCLSLFIV